MAWYYNSPVGKITIARASNGMYGMWHGGVMWEGASDPDSLASNVLCQMTGCDSWDFYDLTDDEMAHVCI